MAEEIIFKVGVDTGNSAEDLKKVEDELKRINDEADEVGKNASVQFEALNKKVKEGNLTMQQSTQAVKDYMSIALAAGKESPIGQAALAEAEKLKNSLGGLGDEIKDGVQVQFEALNKKVEAGNLTMRQSTQAVKEYMSIALAAGRESPIGQAALKQAAELQDKIGDLKAEVANLAHDGKNLQGALQLGGAVAAGYGIAQGMMALTGSESEDLQKSLQQLMAVTTVLNGIETIRLALEKESSLMKLKLAIQNKAIAATEWMVAAATGATTLSMQGLGVAIKNIPIVGWLLAIVAAVIAVIGILYAMSKAEDDSKEVSEQLTAAYDRQKDAIDRVSKARLKGIDNLIRQRTEEGASIEEIGKLQIEKLKEEEAARKENVKTEKEAIDKKNENYRKALKHGNYELAKSIRDEVDEHRKKYKDLIGQEGQYGEDLKYQKTKTANDVKAREEKDAEEAEQKATAAREKRKANVEKEDARKAEYAKTMQDLLIANIKNEDARALAAMILAHEREREEIIKKHGKDTELEKELKKKQSVEVNKMMSDQDKQNSDATAAAQKVIDDKELADTQKQAERLARSKKAELEGKLIQIEDDFAAETELKKELALLELEEAKKNKDLTEGELFKIEAEYKAKVDKLNEDQAAKERQMRLDSVNDAIQWAEKSVNAVQELSDMAFANKMRKVEKGSKEEEKLARKQFKVNKALQLAGAIMDAGKAVTASLAYAPIAIGAVPNPAGIASLAFAGVTSLASIAKIAATQFESTTPPATDEPPAIPNPTEPTASFQPMTGTLTNGLQGGNTKVYVLDSDITAQQNNSQKVESLATMGG